MTSDRIARLSRKLLASCLSEDGAVMIYSGDYGETIGRLANPLRENAHQFVAEIRAMIPTDFTFSLWFDLKGVSVNMDFEDGNSGATAGRYFFTSHKSLLRTVRRMGWDEMRTELIKRGGIFDRLVSEADDRPPNIPSSELAAKSFAKTLEPEIAAIRETAPLPDFTLMIGRSDLGVTAQNLANREEVVNTIADRMTTGNDILAVLERGVRWSFAEIEAAKLEAVEQLSPISRAKAERRFLI